ncbi:MAG: F0F1 ATP synthase subunit A, partial [Clostridia bacterium]|nr:F0F1 ATP synthase subunit A [Deltaproteobacteria bacterium]
IVLWLAVSTKADIARSKNGGIIPEPKVTLRNLVEMALEALYGQARSIIGETEARRYFPVIAMLALFIFVSNVIGLFPGFASPTSNWNTTFACSIFVFLYYNFHGLRVNGLMHIGHMANPTGMWWGWFLAPLMFPIEVVSNLARPFSLGVRLSANMMGDHAVLMAFHGLVPILLALPFMGLGLMVCVIQTLVFCLLTMIYIALSVQESHHDDHGHDDHRHDEGHSHNAAHVAPAV